jgi:hypothetical protein
MRQNRLIFGNNVIYGLQKDYGFRAALYRPTETTDYETGEKIITRIKYPLKKAVFFPNELFRHMSYSALFGRDVQNSGILDVGDRRVLINAKQLPNGFKVVENDYVVFNHERYEIKKFNHLEIADYWHLVIRHIQGQPTYEIHDGLIQHRLRLGQSVT